MVCVVSSHYSFKGTKAIQLLKGIVVIVIGQQISKILNLTATSKLFDIVIQWGVLALIVIFQPEIRRALEQLGREVLKRYTNTYSRDEEKLIQSVSKAVQYMAKRRIGALIVLKRDRFAGLYRNWNTDEFRYISRATN